MMRLMFVVESGTDVRLVEGLSKISELTVLAREIPGGRVISQEPECDFQLNVATSGRIAFARYVVPALRDRSSFDVALVQGTGVSTLAANLARVSRGVPFVGLVCSPAEEYYLCRKQASQPEKPYRRLHHLGLVAMGKLNGAMGTRYVTLSRHLSDVVVTHGAPQPAVIPVYGVDHGVFNPGTEPRNQIRRRLGLPLDRPIIFFSSRIAPEKDSATLLEATRLLRDAGRNPLLVNRSGGWTELAAAANEMGIGDLVDCADALHPTRELPDWYRAADVCVQASRAEGLGFSVLESMACHTPVVAASVGGLRETVQHGVTGLSYETGSAQDLASCIVQLLDSPNEAANLVHNASLLVRDSFASDTVFPRLRSYLENMIESDGV